MKFKNINLYQTRFCLKQYTCLIIYCEAYYIYVYVGTISQNCVTLMHSYERFTLSVLCLPLLASLYLFHYSSEVFSVYCLQVRA
jgi:hypothetical protein